MLKLRSRLPAMKSSFDRNQESLVVCELKSTSTGWLHEECGFTNDIEWNVLDACSTVEKLLTIKSMYISKLKPGLNTHVDHRGGKSR